MSHLNNIPPAPEDFSVRAVNWLVRWMPTAAIIVFGLAAARALYLASV